MWRREPVAMVDNQQLIAGFWRSGWRSGGMYDPQPRHRRPMPYLAALIIVLGGALIGWVVIP